MNTVWAKVVFCFTVGVALSASAVTLQLDQVKQRYPWNGLVDIDYTISYDGNMALGTGDNLEVVLVDHDAMPAVTNRAITFLQAPLPLTEGAHRITWDANADGVTSRIDVAEFIMKVTHYSEAYMVIDVSGGSTATTYRVDFLNGAPPNGFNAKEYKGDKIVLRRIHPGSYMAGSPSDEASHNDIREKQHRVALSKPFYIGVFEVTQQQYVNVMGSNPSGNQGEFWQYRPVENVRYNQDIRGTGATPAAGTFMGILLSKCKSRNSKTSAYDVDVSGFDLPTEFQWEYACRAGTTKAFGTTNSFNNAKAADQAAQLALMGRYSGNVAEGAGGIYTAHTIVGSYQPNPWGLYDMHGNVWEWCRDWFADDPTSFNPKQFVDPSGASTGSWRVRRGGAYNASSDVCRSACRNNDSPGGGYAVGGFRLSRTLP